MVNVVGINKERHHGKTQNCIALRQMPAMPSKPEENYSTLPKPWFQGH